MMIVCLYVGKETLDAWHRIVGPWNTFLLDCRKRGGYFVHSKLRRTNLLGTARPTEGKPEDSGVHKGGFSKGGVSNLWVIIMFVLLNPPLLNPPL